MGSARDRLYESELVDGWFDESETEAVTTGAGGIDAGLRNMSLDAVDAAALGVGAALAATDNDYARAIRVESGSRERQQQHQQRCLCLTLFRERAHEPPPARVCVSLSLSLSLSLSQALALESMGSDEHLPSCGTRRRPPLSVSRGDESHTRSIPFFCISFFSFFFIFRLLLGAGRSRAFPQTRSRRRIISVCRVGFSCDVRRAEEERVVSLSFSRQPGAARLSLSLSLSLSHGSAFSCLGL